MVRYQTHEAHAEANAELVRAVFATLHASHPDGLRYACYRLPDGVSFMHVATVAEVSPHPLTSLPAFKAFQAELGVRCVAPPVVTELSVIGAFPGGAQ